MNPNGSPLKEKGAETEYMIQYKDEEAGGQETKYSKFGKEYMNQIWQL